MAGLLKDIDCSNSPRANEFGFYGANRCGTLLKPSGRKSKRNTILRSRELENLSKVKKKYLERSSTEADKGPVCWVRLALTLAYSRGVVLSTGLGENRVLQDLQYSSLTPVIKEEREGFRKRLVSRIESKQNVELAAPDIRSFGTRRRRRRAQKEFAENGWKLRDRCSQNIYYKGSDAVSRSKAASGLWGRSA